jgi:hypothetical protein
VKEKVMSENLHLYDLVLRSLKDPLPAPWSLLKDPPSAPLFVDSEDYDFSHWAYFFLDHPDYGAALEIHAGHSDPDSRYSYLIGYRKDGTNSAVEEMREVLTGLFTPHVVLYQDDTMSEQDEFSWVAFWECLDAYQGNEWPGEGLRSSEFALQFFIKPVQEPECTLTGPDLLKG